MEIATELVLGFGRTLRAVRERENLSQKELSEAVGISIAIIKRYEQENLELIGPNGFSISTFAKIADFLEVHPLTLFQELMSYTDIGEEDPEIAEFIKLFTSVSENTLSTLMEAGDEELEAPFGNSLSWSLNIAGILSTLPNKKKAEIGLAVLKAQISAGLVEQEEVAKSMQDLFSYTLDHD